MSRISARNPVQVLDVSMYIHQLLVRVQYGNEESRNTTYNIFPHHPKLGTGETRWGPGPKNISSVNSLSTVLSSC